jgi:HEAT repeat protein
MPPLLHGDVLRAIIWTGTLDGLQAIQAMLQAEELTLSNQAEFFTDLAAAFELIERDDLKGIATDVLVDVLATLDRDASQGADYGDVKRAIAHSLGHLGQPNATSSLTSLLNDADRRVQIHAANALERLGKAI